MSASLHWLWRDWPYGFLAPSLTWHWIYLCLWMLLVVKSQPFQPAAYRNKVNVKFEQLHLSTWVFLFFPLNIDISRLGSLVTNPIRGLAAVLLTEKGGSDNAQTVTEEWIILTHLIDVYRLLTDIIFIDAMMCGSSPSDAAVSFILWSHNRLMTLGNHHIMWIILIRLAFAFHWLEWVTHRERGQQHFPGRQTKLMIFKQLHVCIRQYTWSLIKMAPSFMNMSLACHYVRHVLYK